MGTLVSFLITNTSFIHQLFCGNVKFQDSLILVPSTKSVIICMELITDLVDGTKIIESCSFVIPTKELMDKASICDKETHQCTQIVQTSCIFEQAFTP